VDAYRVRWGPEPDVVIGVMEVAGTEARIPELSPRVRCYFRVTAVRDGRESPPRRGDWATPLSPTPPRLTAARRGPHEVELSWTRTPHPDLLGYLVYRRTDHAPNTWEDIVSGIVTDTTWVDTTAVSYVENSYRVSPLVEDFFEGDPSNRAAAFPRPENAGLGILLVNDYMWFCWSDGPYPGALGDPYEMYEARVLTGPLDFTFWDARPDLGWWSYPEGHVPAGYGDLDGGLLFEHGVLIWAGHGPDGPYDERFEAHARLLREFSDAGGVIILAGWQMGSYLPYDLYDVFGVADFGRPNAVLVGRRLLPQTPGLSVIGPGPGILSAPICDVLEPDPGLPHRPLYRLDYPGEPLLGMAAQDERGIDKAFLISVSPSYLDPQTFGADMAYLLSRIPAADPDNVGVPDARPPRLLAGLPHPNPARGSVRIEFRLEAPGRVQVDAFDLQGRRLRRLLEGPFAEGSHALHWDGRDETGRRVAAGVYFLRLCTPGVTDLSRRVVLLD
jgi:hypothetical protein